MKQICMLTIALLAVVGSASAQTKAPAKAPKKETTPESISCAVMAGDNVKIAAATKRKMYADYKGRRYFFCCAGCPDAFKKNPAKYAKSPSIPIPGKKKSA